MQMPDDLRLLCRGKSEPVMELCKRFNEATDDGRNMGEVSELLSDAINSIIDIKEQSDIDREIPYHILFILPVQGQDQAWIGYKEETSAGGNAFKVSSYYHTGWLTEDKLHLNLEGTSLDTIYENLDGQIAGEDSQREAVESADGAEWGSEEIEARIGGIGMNNMENKTLIEYLKQKKFIMEIEKDILDSWNELQN